MSSSGDTGEGFLGLKKPVNKKALGLLNWEAIDYLERKVKRRGRRLSGVAAFDRCICTQLNCPLSLSRDECGKLCQADAGADVDCLPNREDCYFYDLLKAAERIGWGRARRLAEA